MNGIMIGIKHFSFYPTISTPRENFQKYIFPTKDLEAYRNQPVERSAYAHSNKVTLELKRKYTQKHTLEQEKLEKELLEKLPEYE